MLYGFVRLLMIFELVHFSVTVEVSEIINWQWKSVVRENEETQNIALLRKRAGRQQQPAGWSAHRVVASQEISACLARHSTRYLMTTWESHRAYKWKLSLFWCNWKLDRNARETMQLRGQIRRHSAFWTIGAQNLQKTVTFSLLLHFPLKPVS